jgi:hypothetical protein
MRVAKKNCNVLKTRLSEYSLPRKIKISILFSIMDLIPQRNSTLIPLRKHVITQHRQTTQQNVKALRQLIRHSNQATGWTSGND